MTTPLELLYAALSAKIGILIQSPSIDKTKQALYQARAKSGDPDLDQLTIRINPLEPATEAFIFKSGKNAKEDGTSSGASPRPPVQG